MKKAHHRLRRFCAVLIGLVFLASGLLKLLDPVGTGLIVSEYFKFFHIGFLQGTAKAFGMGLSLLEAITGAALITGVFRKTTAIVTSVLVLFFTAVTVVLWLANPEMDCGCFGEAIHLTHAQTLLKNLVLLALALVAFLPFQNFGVPRKGKYVAFFLAVPSLVFALWYNHRHLPMIDFTEFAPGVELFASLDNDYQEMDDKVPTFIYERDGQRGSFSLNNLPDSTWTFVGVDTLSRSGLYKSEAKPVLSFRDAEGTYEDERAVLGKVMVFSVYDPAKADWERIGSQAAEARSCGATPLLLTVPGENVPQDVYFADYKPLITLNRANGGATYFNDGELVAKWSPRDVPEGSDLKGLLERDPVDVSTEFTVQRRIKAQGFALYLLALLMLL
ncbi:MAG: DoxX family protein [Bacteroidales bacterium]|nr:DoxX family protein [Bacteroidales bacterium]